MAQDNRDALYDALIKDGYTADNIGKREEFRGKLNSDESAGKLYDALIKDGYTADNIGKREAFVNKLSADYNKQPAWQYPTGNYWKSKDYSKKVDDMLSKQYGDNYRSQSFTNNTTGAITTGEDMRNDAINTMADSYEQGYNELFMRGYADLQNGANIYDVSKNISENLDGMVTPDEVKNALIYDYKRATDRSKFTDTYDKFVQEQKWLDQPAYDTPMSITNRQVLQQQQETLNAAADQFDADAIANNLLKDSDELFSQQYNEYNDIFPAGANGETNTASLALANDAISPEKMLKNIENYITMTPEQEQALTAQAEKMGINPEQYIQGVKQKVIENASNKYYDKLIERNMPKSDADYIVRSLQNSMLGLITRGSTSTPSQYAIAEQAMDKYRQINPSAARELAGFTTQFIVDAPFFGIGGKASGGALRAMAEMQLRKQMASGMSRKAAARFVETQLANSVGKRYANAILQHAVGGAVNLGTYNAMSEVARQYASGEYSPVDVAKAVGRGIEMGAGTGVVGGALGEATAKLSGVTKLASKVGSFGAEAGVFTGIGAFDKWLEGHEDDINWSYDFAQSVAELAVMKGVGAMQTLAGTHGDSTVRTTVGQRAKGIMAQLIAARPDAPEGLKYTQEELNDLRNTPEGQAFVKAMVGGDKNAAQMAYKNLLASKDIAFTTKQKTAYSINRSMVRNAPAVQDVEVNTDANGKTTVTTKSADGQVISRQAYTSRAAAMRDASDIARRVEDGQRSEKETYASRRAIDEMLNDGFSAQDIKTVLVDNKTTGDTKRDEDINNSFNRRYNNLTSDDAGQPFGADVEPNRHKDGNIYEATIPMGNGRNKTVNIVDGMLTPNEDGSVNKEMSSDKIVYYDPEKGEKRMVTPDFFNSAMKQVDATWDNLEEPTVDTTQEQPIDATQGQPTTPSADVSAIPQEGDIFKGEYNGKLGRLVIDKVDENGLITQARFEFSDGNEETFNAGRVGFSMEQLKQVVKMDETPVNETPEGTNAPVATNAEVPAGTEDVNEESAAQESTMPEIPRENGKKAYHKAPVEATIADLNDGTITGQDAIDFIDGRIANEEKALAALAKKEPTMKSVAAKGGDKEDYVTAHNDWESQLKEAQSKVDYWNEVRAEQEKINNTPKEEVQETKIKQEVENTQESEDNETTTENTTKEETESKATEEGNQEVESNANEESKVEENRTVEEKLNTSIVVDAIPNGKKTVEDVVANTPTAEEQEYNNEEQIRRLNVSSDAQNYLLQVAEKYGLTIQVDDIGSANGSWNERTKVLTLSKDATEEDVVTNAMLHEMTHSAEGTEQYAQFVESLKNSSFTARILAENGHTWESYVADIKDFYSKAADAYELLAANELDADKKAKYEELSNAARKGANEAETEAVAKFVENELFNSERALEDLAKEDKGTLQQLYEAFKQWVQDAVTQGVSRANLNIAQRRLESKLQEAFKNADTETSRDMDKETSQNDMSLSIKSMTHDIKDGKMFRDLVELGGMSQEEADALRDNIVSLVEYMTPVRNIVDFNETVDKEDRLYSAFKPNSDPLYKISIDYSTLCTKRLLTQYVLERLQLQEKRPLSAEEQMAVRDALNEYRKYDESIKVACAMCYVEAARLKSPVQINKWLDDPEAYLKKYFAKKNVEFNNQIKQYQADWKVKHGYSADTTQGAMKGKDKAAMNKVVQKMRFDYEPTPEEKEIIERAKQLPRESYLSADNLANLKANEPVIYDAYTSHVTSSSRAKPLEPNVPYYYGDSVDKVSDTFVENVNRENGMRSFSWSDHQTKNLLDEIAMVVDMSVRGAKMHKYTKYPENVRALGRTGIMINMSGVLDGKTGMDENGNLKFSPTESFPIEYAPELREEFPETAGLQIVGMSDETILLAMRGDEVDYIIPYHRSGMRQELRIMAGIYGWTDYEKVQYAKPIKGLEAPKDAEKWHVEPEFSEFFVGYDTGMTGIEAMRASGERYKQLCKERGLTPKFPMFMDEPNYWKVLVDRKMINQQTGDLIEQKPVKPDFDFDVLKQLVDEEVAGYDESRESNAFNYVNERWNQIPARIKALKKGMTPAEMDMFKKLGDDFVDTMPSKTKIAKASKKKTNKKNTNTTDVSQEMKEAEMKLSIGKKAREEYDRILQKKQPDMPEEWRKEALDYLDSLEDGRDNNKRVKTAVNWLAKGNIKLPEDMQKVDEAIVVASRAKVDPMQYDSPMELLDQLKEYKPKAKTINPDEVDTLTKVAEYDNGITIYDVYDNPDDSEGTRKSRENMRKIINTHFGEDANPWCLLQGDGKGNLTENSGAYWNHYHTVQKQVAFKDGKLIAFRGSDMQGDVDTTFVSEELNKIYGYDFDVDNGFVYVIEGLENQEKLAEELGIDVSKYGEYIDGELSIEDTSGLQYALSQALKKKHKELFSEIKLGDRSYEQDIATWWDRQDESHIGIPTKGKIEGDPLGRSGSMSFNPVTRTYSKPKNLYRGNKHNGTYEEWFDDGSLTVTNYKNGLRDGVRETYNSEGELFFREHYKEGLLHGETLYYYNKGGLRRRVISDKGKTLQDETFHDNGELETLRRYNSEGDEIELIESTNKGIITYQSVLGEDGLKHAVKCDRAGNIVGWEDYDDKSLRRTGEYVALDDTGNLKKYVRYNDKNVPILIYENYEDFYTRENIARFKDDSKGIDITFKESVLNNNKSFAIKKAGRPEYSVDFAETGEVTKTERDSFTDWEGNVVRYQTLQGEMKEWENGIMTKHTQNGVVLPVTDEPAPEKPVFPKKPEVPTYQHKPKNPNFPDDDPNGGGGIRPIREGESPVGYAQYVHDAKQRERAGASDTKLALNGFNRRRGKNKRSTEIGNRFYVNNIVGLPHHATSISSADGAKVLKSFEEATKIYKKIDAKGRHTKGFLDFITYLIGGKQNQKKPSEKYKTFKLDNGTTLTLRLGGHNTSATTYDSHGESNGLSIVLSAKKNTGIKDKEGSKAHVIEYFYNNKKLMNAEGQPQYEILNSIYEALKTGKYIDRTGVAEYDEVNYSNPEYREMLDDIYFAHVENGAESELSDMVADAAKGMMPQTKVTDNKGLPLIVYHGTPNLNFNIFDISHAGERSGDKGLFGLGFYFNDSPKYAEMFAGEEGRVVPVYIDIKKPFIVEEHTVDEIGKLLEVSEEELDLYKGLNQTTVLKVLSAGREKLFTDNLKKKGYDGVMTKDYQPRQIVAFEPSQIKSAEPITYDNDGNIIPLSERFSKFNDIRYSLNESDNDLDFVGEVATAAKEGNVSKLIDLTQNAFRKGNQYKDESRELLRKTVAAYLKEQIKDEADQMTSGTVNNLISAILDPTVSRVADNFVKAQKVVNKLKTRKAEQEFSRITKLKVQDKNGRGISIAKTVDDNTRDAFTFVKKPNEVTREMLDAERKRVLDGIASDSEDEKAIVAGEATVKEISDDDVTRMVILDAMNDYVTANELLNGTNRDGEESLSINSLKNQKKIAEEKQSELWGKFLSATDPNKKKEYREQHRRGQEFITTIDRTIADLYGERANLINRAANSLKGEVAEGREKLKQELQIEAEHKSEIVRGAYEDIKKGNDWVQYDKDGKRKDLNRRGYFADLLHSAFMSPLKSFEFMTQWVSTSQAKKGFIFKHFIEGENGTIAAYSNHQKAMQESRDLLNGKAKEYGYNDFTDAAKKNDEVIQDSGVYINDEISGNRQQVPMSKATGMYVWQLWQSNDGQVKLRAQGFDEDSINDVINFVGAKNIEFAKWVIDEYYPNLRERINVVHKNVFHTSMANIENYAPVKIEPTVIRNESNLVEGGSSSDKRDKKNGALVNRVANINPIDLSRGMFDVLAEHRDEQEEWIAFAKVRKDVDTLLSSKAFRNTLNANGTGLYKDFADSARLAVGLYDAKDTELNRFFNNLSAGSVSGAIGFRIGTGVKQLLSYPAFLDYTLHPEYLARLAAYNPLNPAMWVSNWKWASKNLPSFAKRVEEGFAGNSDLKREMEGLNDGAWKTFIKYYSMVGMLPNRGIDGLTCAAGARAMYDYKKPRLKRMYLKQGLTSEEAEKRAHTEALRDADIAYNTTQQSNISSYRSPAQANKDFISKMTTLFQTSNLGFTRKTYLAIRDIFRGTVGFNDQVKKRMEQDGISKSDAKREVFHSNRKALITSILMGWGVKAVWDIGNFTTNTAINKISSMTGGIDDADDYNWDNLSNMLFTAQNDEEDPEAINAFKNLSVYAGWLTQGTVGGNVLHDVATGGTYNPLSIFGIPEEAKKVVEAIDDYGMDNLLPIAAQVARSVGNISGIKAETWTNLIEGTMNIIEGWGEDGINIDRAVDWAIFFNMPKTQRTEVAMRISKGMSPLQFANEMRKAKKIAEEGSSTFMNILKGYSDDSDGKKFNEIVNDYIALHAGEKEVKTVNKELKEGGLLHNLLKYDSDNEESGMTDSEQELFEAQNPVLFKTNLENGVEVVAKDKVLDLIKALQWARSTAKDAIKHGREGRFERMVNKQVEIIKDIYSLLQGNAKPDTKRVDKHYDETEEVNDSAQEEREERAEKELEKREQKQK